MTARIDPHFERIARRLTTLELRLPDEDETRFEMKPGSPFGRVGRRFVGTYSARGLHTVIEEYGLEKRLKELGLGDYALVITDDDPFRHRLEILLPEGTAPVRTVMDMRLHLSSVALPGMVEHAAVVVVEWLLMQNPRASFTKERPRLPGQDFPGTGLGREVAQLLVLMCRRIGRDGLVVVPERFHLAELYAAAGWLAPGPHADRALGDAMAAAGRLTFPARAWAVERGFVVDEDGEPWRYRPEERVLPVSPRLEKALSPGGFLWLARLLEPRAALRVDVAGLAQSLRKDPVEGMDPDALEG